MGVHLRAMYSTSLQVHLQQNAPGFRQPEALVGLLAVAVVIGWSYA